MTIVEKIKKGKRGNQNKTIGMKGSSEERLLFEEQAVQRKMDEFQNSDTVIIERRSLESIKMSLNNAYSKIYKCLTDLQAHKPKKVLTDKILSNLWDVRGSMKEIESMVKDNKEQRNKKD